MGMYSPDELMNLRSEQYEDALDFVDYEAEEYEEYLALCSEGEKPMTFEEWLLHDPNRDAAGNWIGPVANENGWTP